jgi:type IV pilus assembly protein PilQ
VNALGRNAQDIGQGELRSMNLVQAGDKSRLVLNLRRSVVHEARVDGRNLVITLQARLQPPRRATRSRISPKGAPMPSMRSATSTFRRGRAEKGASWSTSRMRRPASTSGSRARTSSSTS